MEIEKSLNPELWHACAGSMVQIPPVDSRTFYFPQGHAEHTAAAVNFGGAKIPPLILCRVTAVKYLADSETDEVYTKIKLLPIPNSELDLENDVVLGLNSKPPNSSENPNPAKFFAKTLTQSDANNGGGFSVPRYCAETIFPQLDYASDPPVQTVIAKDVHGNMWKFRHIYRGTPRRHLLTTGWSVFVNQKRLIAGDSIVFFRNENDNICVGIRRAKRGLGPIVESPPGWYSNGVNYPFGVTNNGSGGGNLKVQAEDVLEAVGLAIRGQLFEVVYYPRARTPEFCVKAALVKTAMRMHWCDGMRFKMPFETEDSSRISWFMGTVSSARDSDPIRWPNSLWRLLEVTWDEPDLLQNVKRVSPWLVELVSNMPPIHLPAFSPGKKLRLSQHLEFPLDAQFLMPSFSGNPLGSTNGPMCFLSDNITPAGIQGARHAQFGQSFLDLHFGNNNKLLQRFDQQCRISNDVSTGQNENFSCLQRLDQQCRISNDVLTGQNENFSSLQRLNQQCRISNSVSTGHNENLSCLLTKGNSNQNSEKTKNVKRKHEFLLFGQPIFTEQQISHTCSTDTTARSGSPVKQENSSNSEFPWHHHGFQNIEQPLGHCKVFMEMESEDLEWTIDLSVLGSYEELYTRLGNMFGIERSEMFSRILYRDSTGAVKRIGEEPFRTWIRGMLNTENGLDASHKTGALRISA